MNRTVLYGDVAVPIHERPWQSGPRQPYRQTYHLQPGESWLQATTSSGQWEHYVQLASGEQLPVGAVIARELMAEGALAAYFTELWIGRCVLVGPDLMCVKPQGAAERFLAEMRGALGGKVDGLPDVVAFFPDGKIVLREAKNVGARDSLRDTQHEFARAARRLFGSHVDIAVVEWGAKDRSKAADHKRRSEA